jgi:hypothetical protein
MDVHLVLTDKGEYHRIGKNQMHARFSKMYPNKHLTVPQVISSAKDHGLHYESKLRAPGEPQGCFTGVKFKTETEMMAADDLDYGVEPINEYKTKYEELLKKYEELAKLVKQTTPITKINVKAVEEEVEEVEVPIKKKTSSKKSTKTKAKPSYEKAENADEFDVNTYLSLLS